MPDRHPDAMPLSRRHDLATTFAADEQDGRAQWERLIDSLVIGSAAPLSDEARVSIAAMERVLGGAPGAGGATFATLGGAEGC